MAEKKKLTGLAKVKDNLDQFSRYGKEATKNRQEAIKAGMSLDDPDLANPFRSPSKDRIAEHIMRISAGREGVADNSDTKKKKAK